MIETIAKKVEEALAEGHRSLNTREKEIVKKYYGIGGSSRYTLQELGDEYKISRERVRQIKSAALRKIKARI